MKISNSYPYPVLYEENDDYIDSRFEVDYNVQSTFGELHIDLNFMLNNQSIEDLIESGDASYLIQINCPLTSYRRAFKTNKRDFSKGISQTNLRGKIFIHTFIIADRAISKYINPRLNEWYKDMEISFEKGSILAIAEPWEVNLLEDNTELLNLPSIVDIRRAEKNEFMEVDMSSSNITILLPAKDYDYYANNAGSRLKNTILAMVIVPSLTYVFSQLKEADSADLELCTWYQVMERIFEENGYNFDQVGSEQLSSLKAAQMILRKPITTSFEEIGKINEMED